MMTDLYELTMMNGYLRFGMENNRACFDIFYRKQGDMTAYAVAAGLEQAIDYVRNLHFSNEDIAYLRSLNIFDEAFLARLATLRFTGEILAVPEGTIILPQDRYQILMEYYLTGVVATLFQHSQRYSGPLARIYDILEKQERCPFSVTEAAEACHYSRNHFSVLIRRMTGLTAKDFLNQLRVESAKRYLRYSDKNIGEIAAIMGFSSQFHFSDFFKRMTGSSPLHYKKELLQQAAANKRP